jgi:hypothetical protein
MDKVRADTPDPTKYFPEGGPRPGTMLPRSDSEGVSLGFDANRPQKVIVDPGVEGGGFELDLEQLRDSPEFKNQSPKQYGGDVTEFFRQIQQQATARLAAPVSPMRQQKVATQLADLMQQEAVKAAEVHQQYFARPPAVAPVPQEAEVNPSSPVKTSNVQSEALLQQLTNQTQLLMELHDRLDQRVAVRAPSEPPPSLDLGISFLIGSPQKPQYEVYFTLGQLGTIAARYHAVVVGQDCLALVYDTRFEDGFQYLPPYLGEEQLSVTVPQLKTRFTCSSLNLHLPLGRLDIVILLKHNGEPV